jgi:hypothetical protein
VEKLARLEHENTRLRLLAADSNTDRTQLLERY